MANPHPAASLLLRAHSPTTAQALFTDKIQHKPLLLRKPSPPPSTTARIVRRQARLQKLHSTTKRRNKSKPKPLSARERRALCLDDIPKSEAKWALFEGLRELWVGYVREILGLAGDMEGDCEGANNSRGSYVSAQSAGSVLSSADMHGAVIEVVKSRCVSRVGVRGTVVQDRKFVFVVVTEGNEAKTLPKEYSVFKLEIPLLKREGEEAEPRPLVFELHGEQFQNRAPERAKKQLKMHYQPDL
ncbi:ribonuclease P protein subunit p29 [Pseudovirgaria hyperparasitica]|uniref:Ribonuclease P protein subunit n=1 Tax=Pseudovirgaria hyperparasitica TaxID=470096 RepID=A0A6A6VYG3_9PEZI|nr:ribonuclease P protein subunit p29 [Pseudovirgaria hyperparasitica]KAF2755313.1 ribonuclease P protein subunit p29 [Pseudovirgaria hyperparasitica]